MGYGLNYFNLSNHHNKWLKCKHHNWLYAEKVYAPILFSAGDPLDLCHQPRWISSMPDIENKLKSQGGRIVDVRLW
jgi:hypothetical protein